MLRKDPFVTGEYYHIYNRGIDKRTIFKLERDYERFMMLLHVANSDNEKSFRLDNLINHSHKNFNEIISLDKEKPLVSIGAWCLMTNHFHLMVKQEVDGGITKFGVARTVLATGRFPNARRKTNTKNAFSFFHFNCPNTLWNISKTTG